MRSGAVSASHSARCTVVIVNTALPDAPAGTPGERGSREDAGPTEGELLGRAAHVAQVFARFGLGDVVHRGRGDGAATTLHRTNAAAMSKNMNTR